MTENKQGGWIKGPWRPLLGHSRNIPIHSPEGSVALVLGARSARGTSPHLSREMALSNAHLIAAAPDMYEALEAILTNQSSAISTTDLTVALAAMAKARGEDNA